MSKDIVFQLIGKITLQFATMEHRLQGLLEKIMGESNSLVGPMFIHDIPLAALLKKIRFLAKCRIHNNQELFAELDSILKKIGTLREERNLLIHGDWKIEESDTLRITVRDFKLKYDQGTWHEFSEIEFSEKKLRDLNKRLEGLCNDLESIDKRLTNSPINLKPCNSSARDR